MVLALALAGASTALFSAASFQLVRRVARAPSADAVELAGRVGRADAGSRRVVALTASRPDSWERRLAHAASRPDAVERRDELSEVVDELAIELGKSAHWGSTLLRLQLFVGGFALILAVVEGDGVAIAAVGTCVFVGGLIVAANKNRGEALERRQRELADRLLALLDPEGARATERPGKRRR
jgi:hypothetical protein